MPCSRMIWYGDSKWRWIRYNIQTQHHSLHLTLLERENVWKHTNTNSNSNMGTVSGFKQSLKAYSLKTAAILLLFNCTKTDV